MEKLSSKEFAEKLVQFRKDLYETSPASWTWNESTIFDAFRMWFNDSRDLDAWEEAKQQEKDYRKQERDESGEGWKNGD